jgi:hypothetical protein
MIFLRFLIADFENISTLRQAHGDANLMQHLSQRKTLTEVLEVNMTATKT